MTALATSGTYFWSSNRDAVLNRALRLVGNYNPNTTQLTQAAEALNDLVKEWETDGMPLWKITIETPFAYTATEVYPIGVGNTVNMPAPLKILYAYNRNSSVTPVLDSPMIIISKFDYELLGNKQSTGRPSQLMYTPIGPNTFDASGNNFGEIRVYPLPDAYTIANVTCGLVTQRPFADFTASSDMPDFPSFWINALKWGLADQLCTEYGVPLAERGFIQTKADKHKEKALEGGSEEVSIFIQPRPMFGQGGSSH